jgi:hypothetical protein
VPEKDGFADIRNNCIAVGKVLAEKALKENKGNFRWARMSMNEGVAYLVEKEKANENRTTPKAG